MGVKLRVKLNWFFFVACEFMNYFVFYFYIVYKTTSEVIVML